MIVKAQFLKFDPTKKLNESPWIFNGCELNTFKYNCNAQYRIKHKYAYTVRNKQNILKFKCVSILTFRSELVFLSCFSTFLYTAVTDESRKGSLTYDTKYI